MQPTILSLGYRYRRLRYSPFELIKNAFGKQVWCRHCKMEVNHETATGFTGGIHVYRKRCLRCGKVIAYGLDRHTLMGEKPQLNQQAIAFIEATGQDRR